MKDRRREAKRRRAQQGEAAAACVALLALASSAADAKNSPGTERFARGFVALVRQGRLDDPRAFTRLTGIVLRNPAKWINQPESGRSARWPDPRNAIGVTEVGFEDVTVGNGTAIAFSADIALRGIPCIEIGQIVRASGIKATYGGMVIPMVTDGGPSAPYALGKNHANLGIPGPSGRVANIDLEADRAGPSGCLKRIGVQADRPLTRPLPPVSGGTPPRPKILLESLYSAEDYPESARRAYEEGDVTLGLAIGADGRVTDCLVAESSGSDSLDQASCRILKSRASFIPARNAEGKPIASTYPYHVAWKLPPPPLASEYDRIDDWFGDPLPALNMMNHAANAPVLLSGRFDGAAYRGPALRDAKERATYYRVTITPRGGVSRCLIVGSSGSPALDGLICPWVLRHARYAPARDEHRRPVEINWIERVRWNVPPDRRR